MTEPSREQLLAEILLLKEENQKLKSKRDQVPTVSTEVITQNGVSEFSLDEYRRYGRQMIVPTVGIKGQILLKKAKILVIGAGGLGCPLLLYLTALGIGEIGIVDNDTVDESNLHRQVLHTTENVGMFKCDSLAKYLSNLNPHVQLTLFKERLTNESSFRIFEARPWDLILDCTDTPLTRYLINDTAVLCGITIVSGSGVKTDGQLSILNYKNWGPCYRCFYPKPPPANSVLSCKDGGVIGPAIGVMGTMMLLELIKLICGEYEDNFKPFLNLYTGLHNQSLRVFKMRGKNPDCAVCGNSSSTNVTRELITSGAINYSEWCGKVDYDVVENSMRIDVDEFLKRIQNDPDYALIDVRPPQHFDICHLEGAINIPLDDLEQMLQITDVFPDKTPKNVYCICRFGNDSRLATRFLRQKFGLTEVYDVIGGVNRWTDIVDPSFPKY